MKNINEKNDKFQIFFFSIFVILVLVICCYQIINYLQYGFSVETLSRGYLYFGPPNSRGFAAINDDDSENISAVIPYSSTAAFSMCAEKEYPLLIKLHSSGHYYILTVAYTGKNGTIFFLFYRNAGEKKKRLISTHVLDANSNFTTSYAIFNVTARYAAYIGFETVSKIPICFNSIKFSSSP